MFFLFLSEIKIKIKMSTKDLYLFLYSRFSCLSFPSYIARLKTGLFSASSNFSKHIYYQFIPA
jgi:hypothetical protein